MNARRRIEQQSPEAEDEETDREKVRRMHLDGQLDEESVKAAVLRGDRLFMIEAIASLSRLDTTVVQKAFSLASAKGVAAMSWKAGLSAEPAHQMQLPPTHHEPGLGAHRKLSVVRSEVQALGPNGQALRDERWPVGSLPSLDARPMASDYGPGPKAFHRDE